MWDIVYGSTGDSLVGIGSGIDNSAGTAAAASAAALLKAHKPDSGDESEFAASQQDEFHSNSASAPSTVSGFCVRGTAGAVEGREHLPLSSLPVKLKTRPSKV